MGLSFQASNAIVYLSYGAMLVSGVAIAVYQLRKNKNGKTEFLSSNGTRTGLPLSLNFIASGKYLFIGE
ncbi:hypothetical protein C6P42_004569 [Pichia californica]|nr:hypothetical protein C6P42_004569 [[Candida] californica]